MKNEVRIALNSGMNVYLMAPDHFMAVVPRTFQNPSYEQTSLRDFYNKCVYRKASLQIHKALTTAMNTEENLLSKNA